MYNNLANVFLVACFLTAITTINAQADNGQYGCRGKVSGDAYNNYKIRNDQVGGFVADTANIEESVTFGKAAQICNYADVQGGKVIGSGIVGGEATMLSGRVMTRAYLGGDAVLNGATLKGDSKMLGGTLGKGVVLDGFYVHRSGTLPPGVYTEIDPQIAIDRSNRENALERARKERERAKLRARKKKIKDAEIESLARDKLAKKTAFRQEILGLRLELDNFLEDKISGFMVFGKRSSTPCFAGYSNMHTITWFKFDESSISFYTANDGRHIRISSPTHYYNYDALKLSNTYGNDPFDNGDATKKYFDNIIRIYDDGSKLKEIIASIHKKCKQLPMY